MKPTSKPERRRPQPARVAFPIVGLGTSAGGLEALEHFLRHVPKNSGLALVIVQHLDPTRKDIMPELLQRATGMKPITTRDGRWFTVRIMPYRTLEDRIDGLAITFADITVAKTLEAKLRGQQAVLEKHAARQAEQRAPVKARRSRQS